MGQLATHLIRNQLYFSPSSSVGINAGLWVVRSITGMGAELMLQMIQLHKYGTEQPYIIECRGQS